MKRKNNGLAIVAAVIVAWSSTALAHEECDEPEENDSGISQGAQDKGAQLAPGSNVTIKLFQYQPGRIQIRAGTTVTWVNGDEILHTVSASDKAGGFDAPLDGQGKSFSFTFTEPGTYSYSCDRHEQMRGEIEVR